MVKTFFPKNEGKGVGKMTDKNMVNMDINAEQTVIDWLSNDGFIQVNKSILRKIGARDAILLGESISQYRRWKQQGKITEGMFYWSEKDCEWETGQSKSTQNRSFNSLEKRNLLKTFTKVHPYKTGKTIRYIKLNFEPIIKLMFQSDDELRAELTDKVKKRFEKNQTYKQQGSQRKSQSETSRKSQSETSRKSQSETQVINKNPNKKIEPLIKSNRSIKEAILKSTILPNDLKNFLIVEIQEERENRMDRLNLSISDVEKNYLIHKSSSKVTDSLYKEALNSSLDEPFIKSSFNALMRRNIDYWINKDEKEAIKEEKNSSLIKGSSKEVIPEWFNKEQSYNQDKYSGPVSGKENKLKDIEARIKKLTEKQNQDKDTYVNNL